MKEPQAKKIKEEIQDICKKHGLWVEVQEKHKPELKDIILTVSLRIGK